METIVLILMLRMPINDEVVAERVEMPSIAECWKAAAEFLKQDFKKQLGATMAGADCEIHHGLGRES